MLILFENINNKQFFPSVQCVRVFYQKNDSTRKNKYQSVIFSGTLDGSHPKGDPNLISPKNVRLSVSVRESKTTVGIAAQRSKGRRRITWVGVRPAGARERGHTSGHASRREINGDR